MLYDFAGREIKDQASEATKAIGQRLLTWEPSDRFTPEVSRGLSPRLLDSILQAANIGDVSAQARLAREIEEKDFQAIHALGVRRAAVQGLEWHCVPTTANERNAKAKSIAEEAEAMLRAIAPQDAADDVADFPALVSDLLGALLPGYGCSEILWDDGGAGVLGFAPVATHALTFLASRQPLIVCTNAPQGLPLAPRKFVFHRHKARSGDVARSGLIRPLGWMFCFANLGIKDLLRFVERYGMPFFLAKLDENSWKTERGVIAELVRNFGSDGGAVLTKAVEAQLIEASGTGDVYFKLMEFFGDWKTKTILGQLASSGESGGMSKGDAQSQVRRDILESDAAQLAATLRRDVLAPWVAFNYGEGAPVPELHFDVEEPEDLKLQSEIVLNLSNAGYKPAAEEVGEKFGYTITPAAAAPKIPAAGDVAALSDASPLAVRAAARKAAAAAAQAANDKVVGAALSEATADKQLVAEWLGPVSAALDEALAGLPDDNPTAEQQKEFLARLGALLKAIPGLLDEMDTSRLEDLIARAMFAADANGRAQAAAGLV